MRRRRRERALEYAYALLHLQLVFGESWALELERLELGFVLHWDRPGLTLWRRRFLGRE